MNFLLLSLGCQSHDPLTSTLSFFFFLNLSKGEEEAEEDVEEEQVSLWEWLTVWHKCKLKDSSLNSVIFLSPSDAKLLVFFYPNYQPYPN